MGTEAIPDSDGNVELASDEIDDLTCARAALSVPAQRDVTAPDVQAGQALFQEIGCVSCHATDTGNRNQRTRSVELRNSSFT